jgi:hypothetical protein
MKKILLFGLLLALSSTLKAQWQEANNGLYGGEINCIAISGNYIFAGTVGGGIFLSTDNGNSWIAKNNGLTNTMVRSIAISGDNIFAGTWGNGIFRAKLSDFGISSVEDEQIGDLHISPNPASDYLEISGINQPVNQFIDILIFNTLGECVQALKLKTELQGNMHIDVSALPPGLYILKLNNKVQRFVKY